MVNKILMITSRHVLNKDGSIASGGDGTLIYKRARGLKKILNIDTHILPLNGSPLNESTGHEGSSFILKKSNKKIEEIIEKYIVNHKPKLIILSGEKSYLYKKIVIASMKKLNKNIPIILDIHGALEEGIEHNSGLKYLLAYSRYLVKTAMFKRIIKNSSGLLVVSDELREHHLKLVNNKVRDKQKILKIRCGVDEVLTNKQRFQWREEVREKWGIDADTTVFVYSGYRWPWQKIDETIRLFQHLNSNLEKTFFVLLTNRDNAFDEMLQEKFPEGNYFAGILPQSELFKHLSACDVGMLIRDENNTNKVAFPNKISDYLNAGLSMAISDSLKEPKRILEENKFPHLTVNVNDLKPTDFTQITDRQKDITSFYEMCNKICKEELEYNYQVQKQRDVLSDLIGEK